MTPNEINLAIAETQGWVGCVAVADMGGVRGVNPKTGEEEWCPDYTKDLNAMHEAEKVLTDQQGGDYDSYLWLMIQRDGTLPASWHATAAQRAEAFLRTLNLWKE